MAYVTPPTFADGNILTAAQLNTLSDDVEFLYGLVAGGINPPVGSLRTTTDLSSSNNQWLIYHQHQYLHYKARLINGTNSDLDIFVFNIRILHDTTSAGAGHEYLGYIDLNDPTTWDDYRVGGWATSTSYALYDVILYSGSYYSCEQAHTSSTDDEPGVGVNWQDYWILYQYAIGTYGTHYVDTGLSASPEFVMDYLIESDNTTL